MSKCYNIDDSFFISLSLCLSLCYSCVWVSVVWVFMWPCACAYIYAYGEYTVTVGAQLLISLSSGTVSLTSSLESTRTSGQWTPGIHLSPFLPKLGLDIHIVVLILLGGIGILMSYPQVSEEGTLPNVLSLQILCNLWLRKKKNKDNRSQGKKFESMQDFSFL